MTTSRTDDTTTTRIEVQYARNTLAWIIANLEMVPCDVCGDDLGIHEWVDIDQLALMTNCDRKD
jgi:hypothetical protein